MDVEKGPFTEIQAGSYLFMDKQYGAVELASGVTPFAIQLAIANRALDHTASLPLDVDCEVNGAAAGLTEGGGQQVPAGDQ